MEQCDARPLARVRSLKDPGKSFLLIKKKPIRKNSNLINFIARVYARCMELIVRLAAHGLVHCDFNEFNLLLVIILLKKKNAKKIKNLN